jgi:copper transport protein
MHHRRILLLCLISLLLTVQHVSAHSNLYRADPPANSQLAEAPAVISLYFTERLEPEFSAIVLERGDGTTVVTPAAVVDPADTTIMHLVPGDLPEGLYTVVWRALSAEDGHQTRGSYAFAIGTAAGAALNPAGQDTIPAPDTALRWLTHLAVALLIGGVSFIVFVWQPAQVAASVPRRVTHLILIGWLLYGVVLFVNLLLYTNEVQGEMTRVVNATRFGDVWLVRLGLWSLMGISLWLPRQRSGGYVTALLIGAGILLAQSQYSHASAAHDPLAVTLVTWLHLLGTALWLGGLMHFFAVIPLARRAESLGLLTAWFSNMARVALLTLVITGVFSGWLFVGSVDALLTTLYGQALLVKLILIAPVLGIAAINFVRTGRRLRAGNEQWTGILYNLVGAEIGLLVVAIIGAALMASVNPARAALALRQPPEDNTFAQVDIHDEGLHVHFTVEPGWVGQNTFKVLLLNDGIDPVDDATLIRVRFDYLARNLGQSELRPTLTRDGEYAADGANLSQPGDWRVRVTIQRPNQFDVVQDYTLTMELPPVPPGLNTSAPIPGHTLAELLAGAALLIVGGFTVGRKWLKLWDGVGAFGVALLFVGIALILTALGHPTF